MEGTDPSNEFEGVYVAHWEVPRFVVVRGRKFLGLLPRVEKWLAHFPPGFELPHADAHGRGAGRCYRMRVRGSTGKRGHYGHRGICSRELFISDVTDCAATDDPGPTW